MRASAAFDASAAAYELLCDPARLARELPALVAWAGDNTQVLDLACGLGDHLACLLAAGAIRGGTGVDLSPAMVARAAERHPDPRLAFRCGDLATATVAGHDRVMCLGNALACLPRPEDAGAALARLVAALPPGGRLLAQVTNPRRDGPDHACVVRRGPGLVLVKTVVREAGRSLLTLTLHRRGDDGAWSSRSEHQVLLHLDADTLAAACVGAAVAVAGGLDGKPYDPASSADVVIDVRR